MKSIIKHWKNVNGELVRCPDETVEIQDRETNRVLSDTTVGGVRKIVLEKPPTRAGRPVDPFKGTCMPTGIDESQISEYQYNGCANPDDEDLSDLRDPIKRWPDTIKG